MSSNESSGDVVLNEVNKGLSEFKTTSFMKQKFIDNSEKVHVPGLSRWFKDPDNAYWDIKALSGHELARVFEAESKNENLTSIIKAIAQDESKIEELKTALGLTNETPTDLLHRLEKLILGSVNPVITQEIAVKLASVHPSEFYLLTNKITLLTAEGMDLKK